MAREVLGAMGDALREAGYTPNELQGAYDKTELLERYATLAKELGRLPTINDLRFKSHSDAQFPSKSTFERFGSKTELLKQLAEFCGSREGYEDVIRWCKEYAPCAPAMALQDNAETEAGEVGFGYLMKSGRFYKVGRSNSVGRREYELTIQLPDPPTSIHVIRTDDPVGIEGYWHKRFEAKRRNGEWFELNAADIAAYKRRKFM